MSLDAAVQHREIAVPTIRGGVTIAPRGPRKGGLRQSKACASVVLFYVRIQDLGDDVSLVTSYFPPVCFAGTCKSRIHACHTYFSVSLVVAAGFIDLLGMKDGWEPPTSIALSLGGGYWKEEGRVCLIFRAYHGTALVQDTTNLPLRPAKTHSGRP